MLFLLLHFFGCATEDDSGSPALDVSAACTAYFTCVEAVGADAGVDLATVEDTYGADGTCWANETTANDCTLACQSALDAMVQVYPEEPACGGEPVGSAADAEWDNQGVTVTAPYSHNAGWDFGMVQTGADNGWAGEDCLSGIPSGYGSTVISGGYEYCHHLGATGGQLETVASPDDVVEGSTTLFAKQYEATITYVLFEGDSNTCFAWGDDPNYYKGLDCTVL